MGKNINSVIDQLASIDSVSAEIMKNTKLEKEKYSEEIKAKRIAFNKDLDAKVVKAVSEFQATIDSENDELISQYRERCNSSINQLNKLYESDGKKWVTSIFNNIIRE